MKLRISFLCAVYLLACSAFAQEDGAYLFKTYCAICHEASRGEEARGPERDVLSQMTPEHILQVLETGVMQAQAAERSRAQRRILAEYLSGKAFGSAPPDLIPRSAFCSNAAPLTNTTGGQEWNGWGVTLTNTRFQSAAAARLTADDVPRLKLKWAFGYPGATSGGTQPVVAGGRLYVGTAEGDVYSLDAKTGCVHWNFQTDAGVRSAVYIAPGPGGKLVAYFGDQSGNVYQVDASTGKPLWKTRVDSNSRAAITGTPTLYKGRLYVPVSSREESQVRDPKYPCCPFRGSMVALDAATGKTIWKTYTIAEEAHKIGTNSAGTELWGPSGAAIWNAPAVDTKRNLLYAGTGNNYSTPATNMSDSIVAFDMDSGKIRWSKQFTANDVWNSSCRTPERNDLVCPDAAAPDFDFVSAPILTQLKDGRQVLIVANKSSIVAALDPDQEGKILWQQRMGRGSSSGGIMWGPAVDGENVYAANADFSQANPAESGGISAFELSSGRTIWSVGPPSCEKRKRCKPSHSAAVTAIPGVLFSGTWDGRLRAISTRDGKVLWEYDTSQDFPTVNEVKANGGSMSNAGPTVVGGMVFTNSGYSHHGGITPGNVLLGFSVE
jgi:polyvinyl alcohol dehydrogenase (cytochrome)